MDLIAEMHRQSRDTLRLRQAERDPCPSKRAFATREDADRHRLRGMVCALCPTCYRFHYGPPAKPGVTAAIAHAFARAG